MAAEEIRARARSYFEPSMSPAHDWHHVRRVEALADRLLTAVDADGRTVRLAVLLHDIGRAREDRGEIDDHAAWGAREARGILADHGVAEARIDAVCHAVAAHRYSTDPEPGTREAEILSDADNLDALGAVGIARCFTYGGELGEVIHDPETPPDADDSADGVSQYNHFYKKILQLPDRMYTDAGRAVAADRAAFVESFLDRFDREVDGRA
jgi:uncharacterized protein